jgi:hypothetical protein
MIFKPLLAPAFSAYWFIFWLLNGLDKFLHSSPIGTFAWHGKDRLEQFERYFGNMGMPNAPLHGLLTFAGIVEVVVALPFLIAGPALLSKNLETWEKGARIMHFGLIASFAVFLGFIILDVIAGDRAELLEHSTYLAVIAGSYAVIFLDFTLRTRTQSAAV